MENRHEAERLSQRNDRMGRELPRARERPTEGLGTPRIKKRWIGDLRERRYNNVCQVWKWQGRPLGLGEMGIAVKTTKGKDKPKEKKKQAEREVDERTRAIDKLLEGMKDRQSRRRNGRRRGGQYGRLGSRRKSKVRQKWPRKRDSELRQRGDEDSEKKHHIMADENDENESEGSQEETGKVPKGEEAEERKPSGEPIPKSKWKGYIYVPIKEETEETEQQLPKADEMTGRTTRRAANRVIEK
ncbi:hypothetical protein SIIN_8113_T [Serendipita indica DSM 11827]|nr:hypothetical protein SIIN_8113_T [Serendipita indica DSM 11827]